MRTIVRAALALLCAARVASAAAAEETVTFDAFSLLESSGRVIRTGPTQHSFAGEMHGPCFIDAGQDPVPAGRITCVGTLAADEAAGRQTAAAQCRLAAGDGAAARAEFTCEGWRLVGCEGPFRLTGGEGRHAGVTGEGRILLRRYETSMAPDGEGGAREGGFGTASRKAFAVRRTRAA